MKVKIFNKGNTKNSGRTSLPKVNLNSKSGLICLNKAAAELLKVDKGGGIEFAQDEEDLESWFIFKSDSENSFTLRGKDDTGYMSTNSCHMVRNILQSCKIDGNCSPKIAQEAEKVNKIEMFAILTASVQRD